jgi:hypothetical protein
MQTVHERTVERWTGKSFVGIGLVTGTLAGAAMAAVVMVYGLLSETRSFWEAPMAIWAWAFGVEHFGTPGEHFWPIVLGIGAHMVNAIVVGVVFVFFAAGIARRDVVAPVVLGLLYALALWGFIRYVVLPLSEEEAVLFTTTLVAPQSVWWLAHAAFGVTAGLAFSVLRRSVAATPGRRVDEEPLRRVA